MSKEEMLETVRQHKDKCISAMMSGDAVARQKAEEDAKKFLDDNFTQVLDILDDSLSFVLNGGNLYVYNH